jgi:ribonuclease-3
MDTLKNKIGYNFNDERLLETALTHSSFANENRSLNLLCNERLEFLGDSVLGMIVAYYLYENFPELPEGRMTRIRAELVCEQSLVNIAAELNLGKYIMLGKGEELSGGRKRPSILADAVEAIIAALYLDGGMDASRSFIERFILMGLSYADLQSNSDYKTILQEIVQQKSGHILRYNLIGESGPDHMKLFTTRVCLNDEPIGEGTGHTKKEAEQAAAKHALEVMEK